MKIKRKINIAMAGGASTGKKTAAAALFAKLKLCGFDYDMISEVARKIRASGVFGIYRSELERAFFWLLQEAEEDNSAAGNGFITFAPLFQIYLQAISTGRREKRDRVAINWLHERCLEIGDRYQLIVIAEDPDETPYKRDYMRRATKREARRKHWAVRSFCEQHFPEKILLVKGMPEKRAEMILNKIRELRRKRSMKSTRN